MRDNLSLIFFICIFINHFLFVFYQNKLHERAERKRAADKSKAASTAARKEAAAADFDDGSTDAPLAVVNEGFVDGGESSGDFRAEEARVEVEVEVGGHAEAEKEEEEESTIPKAFYGFPAPSSSRPAFFAEEDNGPLPVVPIRWNRIRARHARLVSL